MKYLVIPLFTLSALVAGCDKSKSAIEQVKSITEDKYPVANMPDEPLEKPLEIVREPKRLAMTSTWSAGVKDDGTLWTWGTGSLLDGRRQSLSPVKVEGVNDAVAVSGISHMLLLRKDGTVWGWGNNFQGEIDPSDKDTSIENLRQIRGISNVIDISATAYASLFLTKDKRVFILSNMNKYPSNCNEFKICELTMFRGKDIMKIKGGLSTIFALDTAGKLYSMGFFPIDLGRINNISKDNTFYNLDIIPFSKKVIDFSYGISQFALLEDGSLWSWGRNTGGTTAQGDKSKYFIPKKVPYLNKVIVMNSNSANTDNGNVYIWGSYTIQNKLNINRVDISQPIQVLNNFKVASYVEGSDKAFLDMEGNAWYWGNTPLGIVGNGQLQNKEYLSKDETFKPQKSLFNIHQ